jgi:polysaccharide export outer membrane protein
MELKYKWFVGPMCALALMLCGTFAHAENKSVPLSKQLQSAKPAAAINPAQPQITEADAGSAKDDYQIGILDLLDVKVLYADDISRTVRVDAQGNISLPLVGVIRAEQLTTYQLEQAIAAKLAQDLLQNPQVTVFVKEFTSQRMTIQGAVKRTGVYDFQGKATLLSAISMAGGLDEKANENLVKVIRRKPGEAAQTLSFNLESVRLNKISDPVLHNGDIVVVEENTPISIQGAVRKSGNYYPRGSGMTLSQIVSQAEGFTELADPSDIKVLSQAQGGGVVTVVYNLDKIRDGKLTDPQLRPGDLVLVESSGMKSLIYGITSTLRGFVAPVGR